MQNSLLNQRLQLSLLIRVFALQTTFSADIFIGALWAVSRMKTLCGPSLGLYSEYDQGGSRRSVGCSFPGPSSPGMWSGKGEG